MTGYSIVVEHRIETARLGLFHLLTEPDTATPHRVLYLGGSSHDLRLKRAFLGSPITKCAHVATYEPRGLGRSDSPEGAWTMADYAADALAYMDVLRWETAFVIGESFGGMTALHLALRAPHRVRAMATLSTTPGGAGGRSFDITKFLEMSHDDAVEAWMLLQDRNMAGLKAQDPKSFAERKAARLKTDRQFADPSITSGGYARLLKARSGHDCWARLGDIRCPVFVMAGARDDQAPMEAQQNLAKGLPNATFKVFDGPHGFGFTHPGPMDTLRKAWFETSPAPV